jgi:hypothetical protein
VNKRHPGRSGQRWERVRKQVLASAHLCALCGRELRFDAPPRSRWSPSVDHILPISHMRNLDPATQARLALDPQGLRAVHYGCNARRGTGRTPPPPRRQSRDW